MILSSTLLKSYTQVSTQYPVFNKVALIFAENYLIEKHVSNSIFRNYYLSSLNVGEHFLYEDSKNVFSMFVGYRFFVKNSSYSISCIIDTSNYNLYITKEGFSMSEVLTIDNYNKIKSNYKKMDFNKDVVSAFFTPSQYSVVETSIDTLDCGKNKKYHCFCISNDVLEVTTFMRFSKGDKMEVYSTNEKKWIDYFKYKFKQFDRQIGPTWM